MPLGTTRHDVKHFSRCILRRSVLGVRPAVSASSFIPERCQGRAAPAGRTAPVRTLDWYALWPAVLELVRPCFSLGATPPRQRRPSFLFTLRALDDEARCCAFHELDENVLRVRADGPRRGLPGHRADPAPRDDHLRRKPRWGREVGLRGTWASRCRSPHGYRRRRGRAGRRLRPPVRGRGSLAARGGSRAGPVVDGARRSRFVTCVEEAHLDPTTKRLATRISHQCDPPGGDACFFTRSGARRRCADGRAKRQGGQRSSSSSGASEGSRAAADGSTRMTRWSWARLVATWRR